MILLRQGQDQSTRNVPERLQRAMVKFKDEVITPFLDQVLARLKDRFEDTTSIGTLVSLETVVFPPVLEQICKRRNSSTTFNIPEETTAQLQNFKAAVFGLAGPLELTPEFQRDLLSEHEKYCHLARVCVLFHNLTFPSCEQFKPRAA